MLNINLSDLKDVSADDFAEIKELSSQDIAVIGLAAYFPDAQNIDEFWENLKKGVSGVKEFPQGRARDMDRYLSNYRPDLYTGQYDAASYLAEIDTFDYGFFNISPREANFMDPNQRLFLQAAYHAAEDAGYGGSRLRGSKTGVFCGYNADSLLPYRDLIRDTEPDALAMAISGNLTSVIPSRISYFLDLKGPSISVDTACSSSLTAVHLACNAIRNGDCHMAIAGSSKINLAPVTRSQKLGIESDDGMTRTFDDASDGTGNGEGVVAVLLKPLSDALKDKDHIYAVIKGSAVNQDGSSIGLTAPNVNAQEEVILSAWKNAGIDPETITYIEAHGTGTALGDPIEVAGITRAFSHYTDRKNFCGIGSLKTNIGHLDHAAGIAGLSKAILSLKNGRIPPHRNFVMPNSKIDFINSPVYVNTALAEWNGAPKRCGVSAFGLSGTNCHVILEEAPQVQEENGSSGAQLVSISCQTLSGLEALIENYKAFLNEGEHGLSKVAYTANLGRGHYQYRVSVIAEDIKDLKAKLSLLRPPYHNISAKGIFYGECAALSRAGPAEVEGSSLDELARLYVTGKDIPWEILYQDHKPGVTRIPVYPFEKNRCWVRLPAVKGSVSPRDESRSYLAEETRTRPAGRGSGLYSPMERYLAQVFGVVLSLDSVDIFSGFYELGGDSIKAMETVNMINGKLRTRINIADILACVGIESLALILEDAVSAPSKEYPANTRSGPQVVARQPASAAQQRLFVLEQDNAISRGYNILNTVEIIGVIDRERVENTFLRLISRHEELRASFSMIDGEIVKTIHDHIDFEVAYVRADHGDIDQIINSLTEAFNLTHAPLFRAGLIRLEKNRHIFVFCANHIIADGYSVNLINSEFVTLYLGGALPEPPCGYGDYVFRQKKLVDSPEYEAHKTYWHGNLAGELPVLNLPTDHKRPPILSTSGAVYKFQIHQSLIDKLTSAGADHGASLYMVLLAAYNVLLYKYSGQEDIVVGSSISGRNQSDFDGIVGMFVNTLAIRSYPGGNKSFRVFLAEVRRTLLDAYRHEDYQFEDLAASLAIKRDPARNPVFDTMFVLQNLRLSHLEMDEITFKPYEVEKDSCRFDLLFNAVPSPDGMAVEVEYSTSLFKRETIKRVSEHYVRILEEAARDQDAKLSDMRMLSEKENDHYLYDNNPFTAQYPMDKTLHQLFEEQVRLNPDKIAVISGAASMTYRELDHQADRLAAAMRSRGLVKGDIVALLADRSVDSIVAIMAALKSGGAYLPVDTAYPPGRIQYILSDSGARILLTQEKPLTKISGYNGTVLILNQVEDAEECPAVDVAGDDLAYVLYTSGSTGHPKGVMIEHKSVINMVYDLNTKFNSTVCADDKVLSSTNLSFDVSVSEIFLALCFGAELHFYQKSAADIEAISDYIAKEKITFCYLPPAILEDVRDRIKDSEVSLNKMLVGVEPIKDHVLAGYLALHDKMSIVNGYGPTEAAICATFYLYEKNEDPYRIVPIGKALSNNQVYLLDEACRPVPYGVTGEIYISGAGLSRGYLNRSEMTAESFIDNPYRPGAKMYKTGDLGKRLDDGNIQFVGRADYQVKIRGYRIEPGEIEAKLLEIGGIEKAIVIDREDGGGVKCLCAYIVGAADTDLSEVRAELRKKLPAYMVPSYFTWIDHIPLTANGKTDRKALPEPFGEYTTAYEPLAGETQERLGEIWAGLLSVGKIGASENFFD